MDDLLSDFLIETQSTLAALDSNLAEFPRAPANAQTQSQILELLHTVKGASMLLGLPRLEAISQAAEEVLTKARAKAIVLTPDIAALIVDAIAAIRRIQRVIVTSGKEPSGGELELLDELRAAAAGRPVKRAVPPPSTPATAPSPSTEAQAGIADTRPSSEVAPRALAPGALAPLEPSMSIPIARIEHLSSLVGELVLTRNSLTHLLSLREDAELEEPLQRLSHITSDLGAGLMTTRRQALGDAAAEMPGAFDIVSTISVECGGLRYAVPQRSILELVRLVPGARRVAGDEVRVLRLRERKYAWIRLASLLNIPQPRRFPEPRTIVVMMEAGNGPFGLAVDHVFDVEEIVVRPLPPLLGGISLYSGSAILGDGAIAMVLSPKVLAAELARARQAASPRQTQPVRLAPRG